MTRQTLKFEEVVLHVGLPKTATTSIQNTLFLVGNNQLLEKKGYLYPKSWGPNHSRPMIFSSFCESCNVKIDNKIYSMDEIKKRNERYLETLKAEIAERKQPKLVISGEGISMLPLNQLNALKKYITSISAHDAEIKAVIYVRNPISWAASVIQQQIQVGETYQSSLKRKGRTLQNLFSNRIDKFAQVFGTECIDVYSFEEAVAHHDGPVGHFLSMLGFHDQEIRQFHILKANESISQIAADILSFINEKLPLFKDGKIHELRSFVDLTPFLYMKGSKFDIPYSVKQQLFEKSRNDMKWLKENYGIDYLDLKLKQTSQNYNEFTEEIVKEIKKVYFSPQVSKTLKDLIIQYLDEQVKNHNNDKSKLRLKKLLEELVHR